MAKEEKKRKSKSKDDHASKKQKTKKSSSKAETVVSVTSTSTVPSASTFSSAFSEVVATVYIHLAPLWANNVMEGVTEQLNAFLMKYVPEVDGVVLAHSDVELLSDKGKVLYDSPYCHFFIRTKLLVWKPKKGIRLVGRINLQSEDHIGLLILGTFNASIPSANIPSDKYEWRASDMEPQPSEANSDDGETTGKSFTDERKRSHYGEWIDKSTGEPVGGEDGVVEFDVVDIIEANDILTVSGAL